jgi:hypothetical protein
MTSAHPVGPGQSVHISPQGRVEHCWYASSTVRSSGADASSTLEMEASPISAAEPMMLTPPHAPKQALHPRAMPARRTDAAKKITFTPISLSPFCRRFDLYCASSPACRERIEQNDEMAFMQPSVAGMSARLVGSRDPDRRSPEIAHRVCRAWA